MSYNAILQNSPALNSLKRQQLVKLCKRHALKASGKNVDLIERLKEHGTGLPPEALDYRWELSDGDDEEPNPFLSPGPTAPPQTSLSMSTRPSEQWEMVMDNIPEADENGKKAASVLRTPGKANEFGTAGSKSATKFSLKTAITNSLGFKRSTVRDTDDSTEQPIPGAFDFPDSPSLEPIPGTSAKPGTPAPANARLSLSLPTTTTSTSASTNNTNKQPTTTIRLIPSESTESANLNIPTPPRIAPFKTTFDLEMTPGVERRAVWPASPVPATTQKNGSGGRLYPVIPAEDLMPTPFKSNFSGVLGTPGAPTPAPASTLKISSAKSELAFPKPMLADDVFSPAKPTPVSSKAAAPQKKDTTETKEKETPGHSKPYLFGSPITQPHFEFSPGKMDAATTDVLEEMNKRLAEAGLQKASVDKDTLLGAKLQGGVSTNERKGLGDRKSEGAGERFAKAHEVEFNKMDSITNHYAARRPPPPPPASAGKKRKSEAAGLAHAPTNRKMSVGGVSGGARKKMSVPGGLPGLPADEEGDGGGEHREGEERSGKRMRVAGDEDVHKGRRLSLKEKANIEEERKKQQEKQKKMEATRRHLDNARRRSRSGRVSLGVKGVPSPAKKASGTGGFLGAAKALVRNVWNRTASTTITTTTTNTPPATVGKSTSRAESVASKTTAASLARARSPTDVHPHPPASRPSTSQGASTLAPRSTTSTVAPRTGSLASRPSTLASRSSTLAARPSTVAARPSTLAPRAAPRSTSLSVKPKSRSVSSSSTGPNTTHTVRPKTSLAPSLSGAARAGPSKASTSITRGSGDSQEDVSPRKRTMTSTSTLMRPTASSMAKTASGGASRVLSPSSLRQNTFSPGTETKMQPKKIFTKPVSRENFGGAGQNNQNVQMASLGMAGESMLSKKPSSIVSQPAHKPTSKILPKAANASRTSNIPRPNLKARSSMGAATPKKSSGVAMLKNSKRMGMHLKVRQSEFVGAGARRTGGAEGEAMDVDA